MAEKTGNPYTCVVVEYNTHTEEVIFGYVYESLYWDNPGFSYVVLKFDYTSLFALDMFIYLVNRTPTETWAGFAYDNADEPWQDMFDTIRDMTSRW